MSVWLRVVLGLTLGCPLSPYLGISSEAPPAPSLAPTLASSDRDSLVRLVTGIYRSIQNPEQEVWIASLGKGALQVRCGDTCHGVGFWDGKRFRGVLRPSLESSTDPEAGACGELRFETVAKDTLRALIRNDPAKPPRRDTWVRRAVAPGDPGSEPESAPDPQIGDYVYVEELPEALARVPPSYPDEARKTRLEGTVIVQALVGRDGRVKETKVLKGIAGLDEAAEAAVRQWVFRPAMAKGAPVSVWVAVPIKFSLR